MTTAPDESLPISYRLHEMVRAFADPNNSLEIDTPAFMREVCAAVQKLEAATATALALEATAGVKSKIAYSLTEVTELVPVSRDRASKAAKSGALVAHHKGTSGRWIVRRADVVDWAARGCPTEVPRPSGLSSRSTLLKQKPPPGSGLSERSTLLGNMHL